MTIAHIPEFKPEPLELPTLIQVIPGATLVVAFIISIVKIFSEPDAGWAVNPVYCTYYYLSMAVPPGKRARIEIEDNQAPTIGAIEIFLFPPNTPWPPAQPPAGPPHVTFGGNGTTTIPGPGYLMIHLNTSGVAPKIKLWIES